MDRNLALEVVRVTEAAAISCSKLMGRGDSKGADQAAVVAMRKAFEHVRINGTVVIGEGERDKAPMLYIGEEVGFKGENDPKVDIAVDPLEGTDLCAYGRPNALSVIAIAEHGNLLHAPDIYMDKIAVGPSARGVIDLDASPTENLQKIAKAKKVLVEELTVVILERPRHTELIKEVRSTGARIKLIPDGDVSAAIATCIESAGIDVLFGIGGAPEGVLAAAALRCVGGDMQTRLVVDSQEKRNRCHEMGITDPDKKLHLEDMAKGDVMFAATGVTTGDMLKGVRFFANGAVTQSLVMRSKTGTIRTIEAEHHFNTKTF